MAASTSGISQVISYFYVNFVAEWIILCRAEMLIISVLFQTILKDQFLFFKKFPIYHRPVLLFFLKKKGLCALVLKSNVRLLYMFLNTLILSFYREVTKHLYQQLSFLCTSNNIALGLSGIFVAWDWFRHPRRDPLPSLQSVKLPFSVWIY